MEQIYPVYAPQTNTELQRMIDMGINPNLAQYALQKEGGDVDRAIAYALNVQSQPLNTSPEHTYNNAVDHHSSTNSNMQWNAKYNQLDDWAIYIGGLFLGIIGICCILFYSGKRQEMTKYCIGYVVGLICFLLIVILMSTMMTGYNHHMNN